MAELSKFDTAAQTVDLNEVLTVPGPMSGPGSPLKDEKVWVTLVDKKDNGLLTFNVSWLGIHMGMLQGKADGSSWRFEGGEF